MTINHRRVLMIAPTSFFADYGCHVRILEEVRALQQRGHTVRICTYHNGSNVPGIDIRRTIDVPWRRRPVVGSSRHKAYLDIALSAETIRQAVSFRPDVIHAHLHEGALIGSTVARLLRKPVVFDYQGSLTEEMLDHRFLRPGGKREWFFRRVERLIDGMPSVIVPSGAAAEQFLLRRGIAPERVRLLADAVDVSRFNPATASTNRTAVRHKLGIPEDARVAAYLGLLAGYQGTPLLIEAAREMLTRHPDTYFVIAGYPGVDWYAKMAESMPVANRVLFPGRIAYDDAPSLLAAADVAVAPKLSVTEGNGKLLNYMAMELPTVATDMPTNRQVLGDLGHYAPANDASGFACAIDAAFDDSPEQRAALRKRVRDHFSWEQQVLLLEAIYAQVSGEAPATAEHDEHERSPALSIDD